MILVLMNVIAPDLVGSARGLKHGHSFLSKLMKQINIEIVRHSITTETVNPIVSTAPKLRNNVP